MTKKQKEDFIELLKIEPRRFIAQEVKEAMGDNDWGVYVEDEQGIKGLRYEELIADLIATVKFQDKRISELERRFVNE